MPQIQPYETQVLPHGSIDVRATPDAFGAQVGAAVQNLGNTAMDAAQQLNRYNQTQDVTNVHVEMAKARAEWTQQMQDRANQAQPGDDTFAPTVMKDMTDYFDKMKGIATTKRGQQVFATQAAELTSEFGQKAISVQGELAAKDAVNKYDVLSRSIGQVAFSDQSQLDSAIAQGKRAIDDPDGMFGRVPQTARDKFKLQLEQDAKFAAGRGFVRSNPDALLASIAPDMLKMFDPEKKIVQANAAPGASANISKGALQWAPQVQVAAASRGVNPNIMLAQIDKESGGRTDVVSSAGAQGVSQFMPDTAKQYGVDASNPVSSINGQAAYMGDLLKKYGGDYAKALAAYNWGPGNLDGAMRQWGNDWQNHLPAETSNYVRDVLAKSGTVSGLSAPVLPPSGDGAPAPVNTPAKSTLPFMNGLTWEQQDHLVGEAIQLKNMQMSLDLRARENADYALKKQREVTMGQYLDRIIDPNGQRGGMPTDQEIVADSTLNGQEKQHLVDYKIARMRELSAGADALQHPGEVRRLMLAIHAADSDPTKTYSFDPVMESYKLGNLNTNEMKLLRTEVEQMRSGDGSNFQKQVQMAREKAYGTFLRSFEASLPGGSAMANDAYYRFATDLNAKVEALRKDNKDPGTLLDPKSRDYMLSPERLSAYWPSATTLLAQQAGKLQQPPAASNVAAGTVMSGFKFKGGDPSDKNNWEKVK